MASKIEKAVQQMEQWANDDSHGYDQIFRWGEKGDYDCSSSIIQALENAGIPAKTNGATYTGNMYNVLLKLGFKDITDKVNRTNGSGIIRGDIMLNHVNHVAMSTGTNKLVQASINELGTVSGGKPGDQTGKEFYIRSYYNYPWDCILRYSETEYGTNTGTETVPVSGEGGKVNKKSNGYGIYIGRIIKDSVCYLSPLDGSKKSSIVPILQKGTLVDVEWDDGKYSLVSFYIPDKGKLKEYILSKNIYNVAI